MTGIFLMATQKIFQVILKIWPKNFFVFFLNRKSNFVRKHQIFRNFFCMQNLIFCVHNVVLDTIKLAFIFFSKTLKIPISFVWGVIVSLDQCLIT